MPHLVGALPSRVRGPRAANYAVERPTRSVRMISAQGNECFRPSKRLISAKRVIVLTAFSARLIYCAVCQRHNLRLLTDSDLGFD
jgi:hypothetical protein